ncbi:MAG: PrgI family protein [Candidatus Pacebacteria bacterium]|jgi:hypothetical protein|nr:PrgI family protein [Candidatus Paceibacterota bacterium]
MPIEPIKIPQNVQVEDKLIGPITLKQVIICLVGGGTSFVIWNIFQKMGYVNIIFLVIALLPLIVSAAFAFVKVHGLSLLKIILLVIEKNQKPFKRSFGPRTGISINIKTYFHTQDHDKTSTTSGVGVDKFEKLSSLLDEGNPLDEKQDSAKDGSDGAPAKPVDPSKVSVDQPEGDHKPTVDGVKPPDGSPETTESSEVVRDISSPSKQ